MLVLFKTQSNSPQKELEEAAADLLFLQISLFPQAVLPFELVYALKTGDVIN
jgi:hypothetical protein